MICIWMVSTLLAVVIVLLVRVEPKCSMLARLGINVLLKLSYEQSVVLAG